jgi:hypothetical protein
LGPGRSIARRRAQRIAAAPKRSLSGPGLFPLVLVAVEHRDTLG